MLIEKNRKRSVFSFLIWLLKKLIIISAFIIMSWVLLVILILFVNAPDNFTASFRRESQEAKQLYKKMNDFIARDKERVPANELFDFIDIQGFDEICVRVGDEDDPGSVRDFIEFNYPDIDAEEAETYDAGFVVILRSAKKHKIILVRRDWFDSSNESVHLKANLPCLPFNKTFLERRKPSKKSQFDYIEFINKKEK